MNIFITGASRGLGRAIAEKFASNGHALFLTSRSREKLIQLEKEIIAKSPAAKIKSFPADLSVKQDISDLADWIKVQRIPVDILVNNAGSFIPGGVHDEPEGALENMMSVNLYSAYHLTRKLLPVMMQRKKGHIFNLCSIASLQAYENGGAYSISKFALLGFTKNLRHEMKSYGIKVTAIVPGAVFTDSWSGSGVNTDRIMEPSDIAELVYVAAVLSPQACVEEIIVRPQLGDL